MTTIPLDIEGYPTLVYAIICRGFLSMDEANILENETLLEILTRTE